MTQELCRDVERLILDKMNHANDMLYILVWADDHTFNQQVNANVVVYITRNMLDPPWFMMLHLNEGKQKILCRNREMLEHMLKCHFRSHDFDDELEELANSHFLSHYVQGLHRPPKMKLDATDDIHSIGDNIIFLSEWYHWTSTKEFFRELMHEIEIMIATA